MYLFCNLDPVGNITKAEKEIKVQGNGGNLAVSHKETMPGYKKYA